MENKKFTLSILPEKLAICHLAAATPVPQWLEKAGFSSVTRTKEELSIVCSQEAIPGGVLSEKDWRAFKLESVLDGLYSAGIIVSLAKPLAEADISIFNISTFQTNYILIEEKNLAKAKEILSAFCEIKE